MSFIAKYFYSLFTEPCFIERLKFKEWIKNSKVLIILRGMPGQKKLTFSNELRNIGNSEFFSGGDPFDWGMRFSEERRKLIIVDVPSLSVTDVLPYINYARQYHYMAIVPDFMNIWQEDIVELSEIDNVGGGALDLGIEAQRLEELPVYYAGWFLSDTEQERLHSLGRGCLDELMRIESVRCQLQEQIGMVDADQFWPAQKQRLHVTAKFIGRRQEEAYLSTARSSLAKVSEVAIPGLLLTPRTLSCHVRLGHGDRWLFADRDLVATKPHVTLAVGGSSKPVVSGPDQVEVQRLLAAQERPRASFLTSLGTVSDYGQCRFYLTLHEGLSLPVLFNALY